MKNGFVDYLYFSDEKENKEFVKWIYTRNSQLYDCLLNGMTYTQASEIFLLTPGSIKSRFKKFRHKFNVKRQDSFL